MGGYYDGLLGFLRASVDAGFMSDWQMGLLRVGSEPAPLLQELVQAAGRGTRIDLSRI
jgi:predicted Rossmann-fold nucleotide-binding protein